MMVPVATIATVPSAEHSSVVPALASETPVGPAKGEGIDIHISPVISPHSDSRGPPQSAIKPTPRQNYRCCRCCDRPCSRARVARALDSHTAHLVILLAVIIDVALLVGEIVLSTVCPPAETAAQAAVLQRWETGLSWSSRGIVIALLVHNLALAVFEGPYNYLHQPLHVADTIILVAALALELALQSDESEGGLVAVLLCWRLLRLVHGLVSAGEGEHEDVEAARSEAARLSRLVDDLTARLAAAQRGDKTPTPTMPKSPISESSTAPSPSPAVQSSTMSEGAPTMPAIGAETAAAMLA